MISATFIYEKKEIDDTYLELDQQIAEAARRTPGYIGEEGWLSSDSGRISTVYYWESVAALREFMKDATHRHAKANYRNWIHGYRVEISRILKRYGDDRIPGPAAHRTSRTALS